MKRVFDRYILKEIASPFAIGLLVYTFTLLINQILILSKTLISKGATAGTIFKILLYLLPDLLSFTIPMASLMGVLAGMSRLSSDSEIVALRTMGVRNRQLLKPVLLFSLVTWLLSTWLIMYLAPEANYRFNKLYTGVVLSQTVSGIKPGVFYQGLPFYSLYFRDQERGGDWRDVFLYSLKKPDEDTVVLARRGRFIYKQSQKDNFIVLNDGVVHSFKKNDPSKYTLTFFAQKTETISSLATFRQTRRSTQLVFPELLRRMRAAPDDVLLSLEFHKKFALPFACLALGFLGMSLGISTRKGGKTSGFVISLGIIFIYYVLMTAGRNLIVKRVVTPFWGSWAPTLFLVVIGAWLYRYSTLEKAINWERLFAFNWLRRRRPGPEPAKAIGSDQRASFRWRPLKILDRYVLRRMFLVFSLVFSSLLLVFYLVNILELIDSVIENKVPFFYLLKYDFYATPEIVTIILPAAILTAVLLTFSLMSKNNEVTAVQVSGVSLLRLALPAVFLGLFLSLAVFFIQENILPEANRRSASTLDVIHKRQSVADMEFARNWVLGLDNQIYFYDFYEKRRQRFVGFNILRLDKEFRLRQRISARSRHLAGGAGAAAPRRLHQGLQGQSPRRPPALPPTAAAGGRKPEVLFRKDQVQRRHEQPRAEGIHPLPGREAQRSAALPGAALQQLRLPLLLAGHGLHRHPLLLPDGQPRGAFRHRHRRGRLHGLLGRPGHLQRGRRHRCPVAADCRLRPAGHLHAHFRFPVLQNQNLIVRSPTGTRPEFSIADECGRI